MKHGELQDAFIREDLLNAFDGIALHLAEWLHSRLLRHAGKNWWEKNIYDVLDDEDRSRIDNNEWQKIEDLDLHGLLKALIRNFPFLKGRERLDAVAREVIREMQQVRHRCIGHRPSRGNSHEDLAGDAVTMGKFCQMLGAPEALRQTIRALGTKIEASKKWVAARGAEESAPSPTVGGVSGAPTSPAGISTPIKGPALASYFGNEQLTKSQALAVEQLQQFLDDPNERCFILRGYAGTGKTFLIGGLVRYLTAAHRYTMMMAPTGRAAYVLQERHRVDAGTIHRSIYSLKNLREYREVDENGDLTYKFYFETKNNDAQHDTVFVVDEASMISDVYSEAEFMHFGSGRLLRDLLEFINFDPNDYRKKLILVGDGAQLPPVGMNFSPALDRNYLAENCRLKSRECELVDVIRQLDSSLVLRNATRMRSLLHADRFPAFDFESDDQTVVELSPADFVQRFADTYEQAATRPRSVIVAYTNADVANYNTVVRNILMPGKATITAGDRIVVVRNNYNYERTLLNGQMGLVVSVNDRLEARSIPVNVGLEAGGKRRNEIIALRFRDVVLKFEGENGEEFKLPCKIIEDCLDSGMIALSSSYSKALWVDFRQRHHGLRPDDPVFRKTICSDPYFNAVLVKFGYAVTCHKAQGGEWDTVFVDFAGMNKLAKADLRWSYTALTRASRSVIATNALHHSLLTPKKRTATQPLSAVPLHPTQKAAPEPAKVLPVAIASPAAQWASSPLQKAMGAEVLARLPRGWTVNAVKHVQHQESYTIAKDSYAATARVYYNDSQRISRVQLVPGSRKDLDDELHTALSSLQGITISAETLTLKAIEPGHGPFIDALKKKIQEAGLLVVRFDSQTKFHVIGIFRDGGHEGSFDYYFDKAGRLSREPSPHAGVKPELAEKILKLHAN